MAYSGIGGQAVIEGIMMRSGDEYSLGVRTGDGNIVVTKHPYKSVIDVPALKKIPLVRGVIAFIDSLSIGISTLMESASYFEEEEESEEEKARRAALTEEQRKAEEKAARKAEWEEADPLSKVWIMLKRNWKLVLLILFILYVWANW